MTKSELMSWIAQNKPTLKEVCDDVVAGTQIYIHLLFENKVTIGELAEMYKNYDIKVGGTDD